MSESVQFISPIRLTGLFFNGCEFHVDQQAPTGNVLVDVSLDTPDDAALSHQGGMYVLHHSMNVAVRIRAADEDGSDDVGAMHVSVSMAGAVSVSDDLDLSEEDISHALRVNAVSLFYSSARSYIETLTGMSSVGRFSIPPIDPLTYVDSLDKRDA